VVREAVPHKAQLATLNVLLDGVERLVFGDLHLCVRPARNLDNHVQDTLVLVGEERNVMERRDDIAILLGVHSMFCRSS
jgi:hypothetical protein